MDNKKQQDKPLENPHIKRVDPTGSAPSRANSPETFAESSGESIVSSIDEPEIPVLNDIVETAEAEKYSFAETIKESTSTASDKNKDFPVVSIGKLVESIDKKLSSDLDDFVHKLRNTIKDSIMVELKEQLQKEATPTQSPGSATDNPDKHF